MVVGKRTFLSHEVWKEAHGPGCDSHRFNVLCRLSSKLWQALIWRLMQTFQQDATDINLVSYADSPTALIWIHRVSVPPCLSLLAWPYIISSSGVRLQDTHRETQESERNSCGDCSLRKRERTAEKWTQEIETGLTGKSGVHGCRCSSGLISFLRPALTLSLNKFCSSRIPKIGLRICNLLEFFT